VAGRLQDRSHDVVRGVDGGDRLHAVAKSARSLGRFIRCPGTKTQVSVARRNRLKTAADLRKRASDRFGRSCLFRVNFGSGEGRLRAEGRVLRALATRPPGVTNHARRALTTSLPRPQYRRSARLRRGDPPGLCRSQRPGGVLTSHLTDASALDVVTPLDRGAAVGIHWTRTARRCSNSRT
jgi:hypothetical protein